MPAVGTVALKVFYIITPYLDNKFRPFYTDRISPQGLAVLVHRVMNAR
jgi:hypothetical protein